MRKRQIYPLALKQTQFKILELLVNCDIVGALEISRRVYNVEGDYAHLLPRIKVQLTYLRQALKLHDITIETIRGSGYRLSFTDKQKLRDMLAKDTAA